MIIAYHRSHDIYDGLLSQPSLERQQSSAGSDDDEAAHGPASEENMNEAMGLIDAKHERGDEDDRSSEGSQAV